MAGSDIVVRLLLNAQNFSAQLRKCVGEVDGFKRSAGGMGSTLKGMRGEIGSVVVGLGGMIGVTAGVGSAVVDAVYKAKDFEKSLSELRSLTGVSAEALEGYRESARLLGAQTTQTASEVADAFKLIGSQMPSLLKSRDAMVVTTKSAITLSEASGGTMADSAKALTTVLNNFNMTAVESSRVIDVLASASQAGSADIPYLNTAIEKAGGTAKATGVSMEELVSAIETIAPKVSDASTAGTTLRNIFLTLASQTDDEIKPSVVGLGQAIENLGKKYGDATTLTKMFGKENVTSALALTQGLGEYERLRVAVDDVGKAQEQASINTDNLEGSITRLSSAWEGFTLSLMKSTGPLRWAVDRVTGLVEGMDYLVQGGEGRRRTVRTQGSSDAIEKANRKVQARSRELDSELLGVNDVLKEYWGYYQGAKGKLAELRRGQQEGLMVSDEFIERQEDVVEVFADVVRYLNTMMADAKAMVSAPTTGATTTGTTGDGGGGKTRKTRSREEIVDEQVRRAQVAVEMDLVSPFNEALDELMRYTTADYLRSRGIVVEVPAKPEVTAEVTDAGEEDWDATGAIVRRAQEQAQTVEMVRGKIEELRMAMRTASDEEVALLKKRMEGWEAYLAKIDGGEGKMKKQMELMGSMGQVVGNIGSAFSATGNKSMQAMGSVLSSASGLIGTYASLLSQQMASGVAEQSKLVFPYNLVAMSATASALISIISSLPKFATGGVVTGARSGDRTLVRANGGEAVLTTGQQGRLFELLDGGGTGGGGESVVRGEDIFVALRNYMRRSGRRL